MIRTSRLSRMGWELSYCSFFVFFWFGARRVVFYFVGCCCCCWNSYSRCLRGYIHTCYSCKTTPYLPYVYILSNREMVQYNTPPPKKLSSASIIIIIIQKKSYQQKRTPESGGISKLNLEQSFSYIKLFIASLITMRNRDLPVTKSLPLLHVYIRTCQVVLVKLYLYLYTVPPTNLVVPTYLPTYLQYITRPGGVQDHVLYIFLVRHASFINFLFFSFPFVVARGIQKLPTVPTLPGFFSWMPFTGFILGKVGRYCCRL